MGEDEPTAEEDMMSESNTDDLFTQRM